MIHYTLIHPSRGRPIQAFKTAVKWVTSQHSNTQYILSLDRDDKFRPEYYTHFLKFPPTINLKIIEDDNKNLVDAVHRTISDIEGECVILISDDFDCPPNWDKELEKIIRGRKDYAVKIQDGINKYNIQVMTLPILSKSVIDRLGYIYYPEYTGMFADNDLFEVCHKLGVVTQTFLTFPHNHWVNGKAKKDATYDRHNNNESWNHGAKLLDERRKRNFDL